MNAQERTKSRKAANKALATLLVASDRPGYTDDMGAWLTAAQAAVKAAGFDVDLDGLYCGETGSTLVEAVEADGKSRLGMMVTWYKMPTADPMRNRFEMVAYLN